MGGDVPGDGVFDGENGKKDGEMGGHVHGNQVHRYYDR